MLTPPAALHILSTQFRCDCAYQKFHGLIVTGKVPAERIGSRGWGIREENIKSIARLLPRNNEQTAA